MILFSTVNWCNNTLTKYVFFRNLYRMIVGTSISTVFLLVCNTQFVQVVCTSKNDFLAEETGCIADKAEKPNLDECNARISGNRTSCNEVMTLSSQHAAFVHRHHFFQQDG